MAPRPWCSQKGFGSDCGSVRKPWRFWPRTALRSRSCRPRWPWSVSTTSVRAFPSAAYFIRPADCPSCRCAAAPGVTLVAIQTDRGLAEIDEWYRRFGTEVNLKGSLRHTQRGRRVGESTASLDATVGAFGRASFATVDVLRRALGHALGTFGLDPDECPYRIFGVGPHWRLRDYGGHDRSLSLLIVAAPIKRAYIWDLAPSVSAIRYCMQAGFHVHLLEWMPASQS